MSDQGHEKTAFEIDVERDMQNPEYRAAYTAARVDSGTCPKCGSEDPECSRCGRGALPIIVTFPNQAEADAFRKTQADKAEAVRRLMQMVNSAGELLKDLIPQPCLDHDCPRHAWWDPECKHAGCTQLMHGKLTFDPTNDPFPPEASG